MELQIGGWERSVFLMPRWGINKEAWTPDERDIEKIQEQIFYCSVVRDAALFWEIF